MLCGRPLASFTFLINVRSSLCPFISVFLSEQSMGQSAIDHSVLTDDPGILCLFYLECTGFDFFSRIWPDIHFQIRPGPEPGLDSIVTT